MIVLRAAALLLASLALDSSCFGASPFAKVAELKVGAEALTIGADASKAERHFDCAASKIQKTVRRCKLKAASLPFASSLGRAVDAATVNLHFQGEAVNMSLELSRASSVDEVLSQLKTALGKDPGVQYWADDEHLYASYIWVDKEAEIELTKTVKGDAGDGKVRIFVSSILGGRPPHPDDAP